MELTVSQQSEKDYALRVIRKTLNILNTWGNVLVPNIPGKTETYATDSMEYYLSELKIKFKLDTEKKIYEALGELENTYPSK